MSIMGGAPINWQQIQSATATEQKIADDTAIKMRLFGDTPSAWDGGVVPGTTAPPPAPTVDPNDRNGNGIPDWYEAEQERRRTSAFDTLNAMFKQWGIDMDGTGLAAQVRDWVWGDKSQDAIIMEFRNTKAYNDRFTGMADLIKRGQFMSEAEYIQQERSYRNVMTQWNLPTNFYDDYKDYGRFIANGVSVKELDDRIRSAKTFLDENAPAAYKQALASMYGVSEGDMLAYVLDGDRAQSLIVKQVKATAFAGAGSVAGFSLDTAEAEKYGATLGQNFDAFGADQRTQLESTLSELGIQARNDVRLGSIDQENVTMEDTLDAEILSDTTKKLASRRRALREAGRFAGTSAVTTGSLSRNSGS